MNTEFLVHEKFLDEIISYQKMLSSQYSWCDYEYWNTKDVSKYLKI